MNADQFWRLFRSLGRLFTRRKQGSSNLAQATRIPDTFGALSEIRTIERTRETKIPNGAGLYRIGADWFILTPEECERIIERMEHHKAIVEQLEDIRNPLMSAVERATELRSYENYLNQEIGFIAECIDSEDDALINLITALRQPNKETSAEHVQRRMEYCWSKANQISEIIGQMTTNPDLKSEHRAILESLWADCNNLETLLGRMNVKFKAEVES